jgi:ABC-2 type transport system ATP-binding protein
VRAAHCGNKTQHGRPSVARGPDVPQIAADFQPKVRVIDVRGLSKTYGSFTAVRSLSFNVASGEVLGLVGPNGAGKTTTLRSLAGIIIPTAGDVLVDGISLRDDAVEAKRRLAFVSDEPQLFEYLTVDEHLAFIGRLYGVSDAAARAAPLLSELELTDKRNSLPGELSRGMRQKLAIACALLHDPQVLLLDEPLTGLDPVGIRKMKATIAGRAAAGSSIILSSHLLHLVEELCTRLLVIQSGEVRAFGTVASIVAERPELAGLGLEDLFLALTGADAPPRPMTPLGTPVVGSEP